MVKGLKIEAVNLNKILLKCDGQYLYGDAVRTAMNDAVWYGQAAAQNRAPWKDGNLFSSITRTIDSKPIPTWGKVTTDLENKGFRYPWALNSAKQINRHHSTRTLISALFTGKKLRGVATTIGGYHYQSGPNKGKSTRNWFKGVSAMMKRKLRTSLDRAGRAIETKWAA